MNKFTILALKVEEKLLKFHPRLVDFIAIRCVSLLLLGKREGDNQVQFRYVPAHIGRGGVYSLYYAFWPNG